MTALAAVTTVPWGFWLALVLIAAAGAACMWACEHAPEMPGERSQLDYWDEIGGPRRG